MLEATNQPQAFYTKTPTDVQSGAGLSASSGFGSTGAQPMGAATPMATMGSAPKKKSNKKFLAILVLALFAVVASVGVFISIRQQQVAGPQAPTAPTSKPAASEITSPTCTIEWEVGPLASPIPSPSPIVSAARCTEKAAYTAFVADGNATLIAENSKVKAGDTFVYRLTVTAGAGVTDSAILMSDTLPEVLEYVADSKNTSGITYTAATRTVSANLGVLTGPVTKTLEFKVRVLAAPNDSIADLTFTNAADVTGSRASCRSTLILSAAQFSCGTACTNDAQCETIDTNHYCHPTLRVCRLESNPTNASCQSVVASPSPSPSPTVSPSPSASPITYTCNSSCSSDAECQTANSSYVCDATAGNKCRLDTNRTNTACEPAVATYPCGSSCTTDTQCASYDNDHICYGGTCRLSSNPTASNCQPVVYSPPPVAVGCNEVCSTNSDCSNSDHICYTTADGTNKCRLANYVNSDTCTAPQVAYTPPASQPQLPAELPKTGGFELMQWLKAGLVTLGIGAALLLLL